MLPWHVPGGAPLPLDCATIRELLPAAFAIAMLGAIESLLSAVVADGMAGTRHDPNAELLALGIGNIVVPVLRRHRRDRRARPHRHQHPRRRALAARRGRSTRSFVLAARCSCWRRWSRYLPMAALAALLLLVAWNMSEAQHFVHVAARRAEERRDGAADLLRR